MRLLRRVIVAYVLATLVLGTALIVLRHSESRGALLPAGSAPPIVAVR
jgi:hypothetical protein